MAQKRPAPKSRPTNVVSSTKGSKNGFYILIAVIAVIGIAALSYLATQSGKGKVIALDPNLPPVTSQGYTLGNPNAPIELVEFGDFECPSCAYFAQVTEPDLRAKYINSGSVRMRFIDFPLSMHRNTLNASNAAACANEQGKFWEMHDQLFATQDQWNTEATTNPDKFMKELGRKIGLDGAKFDECIDSRRNMPKIQAHLKLATDRGFSGTPTFVIGGNQLNLRRNSSDDFAQVFDSLLAINAKGATKKP